MAARMDGVFGHWGVMMVDELLFGSKYDTTHMFTTGIFMDISFQPRYKKSLSMSASCNNLPELRGSTP